jgi:hypothetical protein
VKRIIWSSVLMLFGVLMIIGAVSGMMSDEVTCGSEVMHPGDICEGKTKSGARTTSTYEESQSSKTVGTIVGVVFGVVFIGLGGLSLRVGIRNRKRGPVQPAGPAQAWGPAQQWGQETPQPQWGPNQGQQQWNPQQAPQAQPWPQQRPQGQQPPPPERGR